MKPARIPKAYSTPTHWAEIPGGEYYRASLESQIRPWLAKMFGFHMLKIGNLSAEIDTESCAISHQVNVAFHGDRLQVQADPHALPFARCSIDACILAHTFCWDVDPHRVLREADRVLMDDGWLIISEFNPFSLIGLGKIIPFKRTKIPYNSRMFTQIRQIDWLSLLNFEVMHCTNFHVLPWNKQGGKFLSTHLPALGCMQVIVARKRTIPLTLNPLRRLSLNTQLRPVVGATRQYRKP